MPRALISGMSVAGPAAAFWLDRAGWDAVLVERSEGFRAGGQNIDVRGAAREVLRRMGLEDAALAATTGEQGTRFLGEDGEVLAEFPVTGSETSGPTAEMEVLRGDLAQLLLDAVPDRVERRFGDRVRAIDDDGDRVRVDFEHADAEDYDLVVAADGVRSSTRALLPVEAEIRPVGLEMSFFSMPRTADDDDWWRWYPAPDGRSLNLRPDRHGRMRALLSEVVEDREAHPADERRGADLRSDEEQRQHLHERFAGAGWQAERLLAGLDDADDLYFESIGQVHAARWSHGRVALTGDAAWCATPIAGAGTGLALVGAHVLAGELVQAGDVRVWLAAYEERLRPWVERSQHLPPGGPRPLNPTSRPGLAALRTGLRIAGSAPVRAVAERLTSPPADEFDLPDYPALRAPDGRG